MIRRRMISLVIINTFWLYKILLYPSFIGCTETPNSPISIQPEETMWKEVPEFNHCDIRYMIQFNSELYATVVNTNSAGQYRWALLKTGDGNSWSIVKTFSEEVGPMTVEGDSLYVLTDHFIHKMNKLGEWVVKFGLPWQIADAEANGDMVFLNGDLYVAQTRFTGFLFAVSPDSQWQRIYYPDGLENGHAVAKFLKSKKDGVEFAYIRTRYGVGSYFATLINDSIKYMHNGLLNDPMGFNSMTIHNDTLFAGFEFDNPKSSVVVYWSNNGWRLYFDSLPNSKTAFNYLPPSITIPTVILFVEDDLLIATTILGVLKRNGNNGWKKMNFGIKLGSGETIQTERYISISFLEFYKGVVFCGYGNPAYMWGSSIFGPRVGLYKTEISNLRDK